MRKKSNKKIENTIIRDGLVNLFLKKVKTDIVYEYNGGLVYKSHLLTQHGSTDGTEICLFDYAKPSIEFKSCQEEIDVKTSKKLVILCRNKIQKQEQERKELDLGALKNILIKEGCI